MSNAPLGTTDRIGSEIEGRFSQSRPTSLLVDLSHLTYIGSAMVALMVRVWKVVQARGGRMVVVANHPQVLEVLRIAGLEQIWTITPTRGEGVRALGASRSSEGAAGDRLGLALAIIGALAVIGASVVLFLQSDTWLTRSQAFWTAVACSLLGLILGTVAAVRESGSLRAVGAVVAVGGLALLVVALLRFPGVNAAVPPAAAILRDLSW